MIAAQDFVRVSVYRDWAIDWIEFPIFSEETDRSPERSRPRALQ